MIDTKMCSECKSEIPADAAVCRSCGERIEGRLCPECRSYCKTDARICRWCRHPFWDQSHLGDFKPFSIRASMIGSFLRTGNPFPQYLRFNRERITVTSWGFMGIFSTEEEFPWDTVAGFTYRSGIFWDEVLIQIRSQVPLRIRRLKKRDGQVVKRLLQSLEK